MMITIFSFVFSERSSSFSYCPQKDTCTSKSIWKSKKFKSGLTLYILMSDAYSPYFSLYISYVDDKENLFNN